MPRSSPEAQIQRAVFHHLRARGAPGVFAFHPANGGFRRPAEAVILKGLGVIAGVPDVFIIYNGRCFAMELKAKGGRATAAQLATLDFSAAASVRSVTRFTGTENDSAAAGILCKITGQSSVATANTVLADCFAIGGYN